LTRRDTRRVIVENLPEGTDLYHGIVRIAVRNDLQSGTVTGSGTVKSAVIAMFDQKTMTVRQAEIMEPMEIISLYGTLLASDRGPIPRIHLVLADGNGNGKGGELLAEKTPVHRCQIIIEQNP
jgi:predicted DNA-binding protein with PD1-like motif